MSKYNTKKYQVFEENGKKGVIYFQRHTGEPIVVVEPSYDSVEIMNNDKKLPESIIQKYERDESVYTFGEFNSHYILADGKYILAFCDKLLSKVEFERVIKLTFCHYLCLKSAYWELYHHIGPFFEFQASFRKSNKLMLSGLINKLDDMSAYQPKSKRDTDALARRLYKDPHKDEIRYLSEYRHYWGSQRWETTHHDFYIYTERVIMHEDFSISPYDRVYPK